jgi:hypothetical protein
MRNRAGDRTDEKNVPIHVINQQLSIPEELTPESVVYKWDGTMTPNLDDKDGVARISANESGKLHCYIKRGIRGPNKGMFYNPQDPMYAKGQTVYEYSKVTQAAFDSYLRFIKTKNVLHLRHAERS